MGGGWREGQRGKSVWGEEGGREGQRGKSVWGEDGGRDRGVRVYGERREGGTEGLE